MLVKDKIRGCLFGGAAGDALGYPVEFMDESAIRNTYGKDGIRSFVLTRAHADEPGTALFSDDTQMTLFTAWGLFHCPEGEYPRYSVAKAYQDWLDTQEYTYNLWRKEKKTGFTELAEIPELYARRAPGNTCMSALAQRRNQTEKVKSYIRSAINHSKGCGGIMRISPLALYYPDMDLTELDKEGAELSAITHSHSLGYMPSSVLIHILHRIVYPDREMTLKEIVLEARDILPELFPGDRHLDELKNILDLSLELSENNKPDQENIHLLGEGWVAEETLGIALYCALRYSGDFSAGIIAAVNHRGDSDSTGAVTGNILGAWLGYDQIGECWKKDLELKDLILDTADRIAGHN
ncbi:MAG: ADP-ribosylglycohydrolase family protein [Solobacterium sp.]|nr:ADP-ribosylglycohydrolase family protein [Solobacterium sp.]